MKYTKLGKSDLNVSRICMGCMGFGNAATGQHSWAVDEELTGDEIAYLEEPYVPHALVGVMAQNGKQKAGNVVYIHKIGGNQNVKNYTNRRKKLVGGVCS